ncbi:MAG TPA: TolC family outer membrane protein [Dongiaceae bacterium]|jgi:adhesin transport system outer membrane protein|nr:TolC family outer membrane protein [Dongiaceae bacterium]
MNFRNCLAASSLVVLMHALPASALSLHDAVNLTVATNPEIGLTAKDRRASEHQLRQARGQYYPQIDVTAEGGPEFTRNDTVLFGTRRQRLDLDQDHLVLINPNTTPRYEIIRGRRVRVGTELGTVRQNASDELGAFDYGLLLLRRDGRLTVSQLLFDGFLTDGAVEEQKARLVSAARRVEDQTQTSALDAVQAYIDVFRHRQRLAVAQENIDAHLMTLDLVRKRAELGGGNIADVYQTEARLATARTVFRQIEGDLHTSEATFQRVVGVPATDLLPAEDIAGKLPPTVDLAVAQAIANSPRIRLAQADIDAAQAVIRQAEAPFYPDAHLQVSAQAGSHVNGDVEQTLSAQALLVLHYNLYRGGIDAARVREAKERRNEAIERLEIQQRIVAEELRISWALLQSQKNRVMTLTEQTTANQNTRNVYLQQFDIGQRSLLDLLDATNELFLAREGLIDAQATAKFAAYRVLSAEGALVQTLGIPLPPEAIPTEVDYGWAGEVETGRNATPVDLNTGKPSLKP